jgi:hypothetical protein
VRYTNLSTAYADVIVASVGGHTHSDEFQVFHTPSGAPAGVYYIAPSVTTFTGHNPAFRVYEVDAGSMTVQDYTQHFMNLTRANAEGAITWETLYSARAAYGLPDMSAASWDKVRR